VAAIIEFAMRRPNIEVDSVVARVSAIHTLLPNLNIADLLRRQPSLLNLDPKTVLAPNFEHLKNMLHAENSPEVVERVVSSRIDSYQIVLFLLLISSRTGHTGSDELQPANNQPTNAPNRNAPVSFTPSHSPL
jgi:hypothetical protein